MKMKIYRDKTGKVAGSVRIDERESEQGYGRMDPEEDDITEEEIEVETEEFEENIDEVFAKLQKSP